MINEVRNAVLSVLNKNNYGYISPSDFNLFALNAQMEIYEEYYSDYNKAINAENGRVPSGQPTGGSLSGIEYANIEQPIAEVMESFLRTDYLSKVSANIFSEPSALTTGYAAYMILELKCKPINLKTGTNTSVVSNQLVDSTALFTTLGIVAGDVVVNVTTGLIANVVLVSSNTVITLDSNIFLASGNVYSILSSATIVDVEKVSNSKVTLLNNSNLTPPTIEYPIYALQGEQISVYPSTISTKGQIQATYFRYPKPPKWTFITLTNGEPVFDQSQSDYQDFELPATDEYKLVMITLQYCGVSIREADVVQFAMGQETKEKQP